MTPPGPDELVRLLRLEPHPEGGWFRETWRDSASTAIYFLLRSGERSRRHRIDKAEIWHFYAGDPLVVSIEGNEHVLGPDVAGGQRPQIVVPAQAWQAAWPLGEWTLVGCTVAPPFEFDDFELGPD